jgi:hypothetical protein
MRREEIELLEKPYDHALSNEVNFFDKITSATQMYSGLRFNSHSPSLSPLPLIQSPASAPALSLSGAILKGRLDEGTSKGSCQ